MLPGNVLSSQVESAPFLEPKTGVIKSPLIDFCRGGLAVGNSSEGLNSQDWTITAVGKNVIYSPKDTGSPSVVLTTSEIITWVSGTFDQAMRPFVTYVTASGGFYYWYDSTIPGYTITALPAHVDRPFACLDDNRTLSLNSSDIILSYVNGTQLYYRQQRDRYLIEYDLGDIPAEYLVQTGPNRVNRFQFEFRDIQVGPPSMLVYWSDDGGYTWSNPRTISLGDVGEYNRLCRIFRLGVSRNRLWKITYKEPTKFTLFGADCDVVSAGE